MASLENERTFGGIYLGVSERQEMNEICRLEGGGEHEPYIEHNSFRGDTNTRRSLANMVTPFSRELRRGGVDVPGWHRYGSPLDESA